MLPTTIIYYPVKIIKALSAPNIYFAIAWIWTLLIAFLCLFSLKKFPTLEIGGGDKYGHVVLHFGFTILWFLYCQSKSKIPQLVLKIVIVSVVYGAFLEIMQGLFTATRKTEMLDVVANTTGALTAALVIYLWNIFRKKRFYN